MIKEIENNKSINPNSYNEFQDKKIKQYPIQNGQYHKLSQPHMNCATQ